MEVVASNLVEEEVPLVGPQAFVKMLLQEVHHLQQVGHQFLLLAEALRFANRAENVNKIQRAVVLQYPQVREVASCLLAVVPAKSTKLARLLCHRAPLQK